MRRITPRILLATTVLFAGSVQADPVDRIKQRRDRRHGG